MSYGHQWGSSVLSYAFVRFRCLISLGLCVSFPGVTVTSNRGDGNWNSLFWGVLRGAVCWAWGVDCGSFVIGFYCLVALWVNSWVGLSSGGVQGVLLVVFLSTVVFTLIFGFVKILNFLIGLINFMAPVVVTLYVTFILGIFLANFRAGVFGFVNGSGLGFIE